MRHGTPQGGWANEIQPDDCVHTLIAVFTDEGVTGWGSAFANDELVRGALHLLAPLYLGENPLEPERVSEKLHQHTFWMGRGGSVTHAISGIDIALWDILGKVTGQPAGRLLGGRYRDRVLPYASLLMREPGALAEQLAETRSQGFRAFKIGWGPFGRTSAAMDESMVRAAREAVSPGVAADGGCGRQRCLLAAGLPVGVANRPHAGRLRRALVRGAASAGQPARLRVLLRTHSPVPIAGGEVLTRRQSFIPWLQQRAFDIVQPDVTKVGGISEERRIAWMAEENGIRFIPHGWNTALGLAADLQLASAARNTGLVEYLTGSPFVDDLVETRWKLDADGMLAVPDRPGLGIALNMDAVEKHTGERFR